MRMNTAAVTNVSRRSCPPSRTPTPEVMRATSNRFSTMPTQKTQDILKASHRPGSSAFAM